MRTVSPDKEKAILAAADALVAEGVGQPTNDQVRAKLGGGSIADISPVMRKWREAQKQTAGNRLTMPLSIVQVGERFVSQLWSAAEAEAAQALETLRAERDAQVEAIEAERDEALGEITRLEASAKEREDALKALQKAQSDCERQLATLTQEHHALDLAREKAVAQAHASRENQALVMAQLKEAQASIKTLQSELMTLARTAGKSKTKK